MNNSRKVVLYIAMSLDGCIESTGCSLDFLSIVEKKGEDYGYSEFYNTVDTIILGRRTYQKVISMGYDYANTGKEVIVITRTQSPSIGNLKFYTGNLTELIMELKTQEGKNIYCDGGARIVNELQRNDLIDEYIISIIPVLLGGGLNLFRSGFEIQKLDLLSSKQFEKGLVQLHYQVRR